MDLDRLWNAFLSGQGLLDFAGQAWEVADRKEPESWDQRPVLARGSHDQCTSRRRTVAQIDLGRDNAIGVEGQEFLLEDHRRGRGEASGMDEDKATLGRDGRDPLRIRLDTRYFAGYLAGSRQIKDANVEAFRH